MAILQFLTLKIHLSIFLCLVWFCLLGWDLVGSPGSSQGHGLPASAFAVLGYQAFTTMSRTIFLFFYLRKVS